MVTRKPVTRAGEPNLGLTSNPPYPATPISAGAPPPFRMQDARNEDQSTPESEGGGNVWGEEGLDHLNAHTSTQGTGYSNSNELPQSLRVGPASSSKNSSQEMLRPNHTGTNPFLQRQNPNGMGKESSTDAWGGFPEKPAQPPSHAASSQQFTGLSVSEPSTNPWQPALDEKARTPPPPSTLSRQDSGNEAWAAPARPPPTLSQPEDSQQPVLIDLEEPESPAWDEDEESSPVVHEMPTNDVLEVQQIDEGRHAWDESKGHGVRQGDTSTGHSMQEDVAHPSEAWNLVDHETVANGAQQSGVVTGAEQTHGLGEPAPTLPPRRSTEQPPTQPPRPNIIPETRSTSSLASPGTLASTARMQKKETYEIKKITWHDVTAAQNPRVSPILVQNANGPCPLLALVNALTLSTPSHVETALVETLRSREQVSLGLLLDAVFDELMSGRRGDAAQELPDVSDLYSFLVTLHTGMNVNPRFFPPDSSKSASDFRNSMTHVHPVEREATVPGTFEDTREMKLYSTFSIPLIHGWIPDRDSPAYIALSRSAKSYEDAQNLMFHEEVLEEKLVRDGLSFEEQAILEDITTIKAFFSSNATQLTPFGLEAITKSLAPGAVAILFRNDHFSTLYRHPDTLQLLQLVTDMGYAGHEEVVWESLIDVTGENAEFFSGDFRLVGGALAAPQGNNVHDSGDGWTTVTGHQGSHQPQSQSTFTPSPNRRDTIPDTPHSPTIEQEDHDLALALQLQEEEEERHRNEIARRRRETELSQQYIEQQGSRNNNVPVNIRGGSRGGTQTRGRGTGAVTANSTRNNNNTSVGRGAEVRPSIPPRRSNAPPQASDPEGGIDTPPPSYEQAANQAAYVPPANHPSHPTASPTSGRRMSAYTESALQRPNQQLPGRGRRVTTSGPTLLDQVPSRTSNPPVNASSKDKDCIVM
ncbi:hypothetical protein G7Y89_g14278 [Cudoniella acicularis]|uniref:MINDY deubiquitinase domain-containing protein n=1 Tax=Cudoniella acicularis TaxID=354080 RepID=A0A8H4R5M9_9HELO|nr:hypothetical protein G7Y89_g14278 [Cudoniella acicularis]